MKNYRTPRTIAECNFDTGYPIADLTISNADRILGWMLAGAIGIGLGLVVAFNI